MAQTTEKSAPAGTSYTRPTVADYGSLETLTADFDLNFVGSVAKTVTIAAASPPLNGGGGDPRPAGPALSGDPPPMSDLGPPPASDGTPPPDGGVVPDGRDPAGAELGETERGGGGDVQDLSGTEPGQGGAPGGGGVREELAGAGGLPFTGYAAWAAAAIGAAMTTSGVVLRDLLRRRS